MNKERYRTSENLRDLKNQLREAKSIIQHQRTAFDVLISISQGLGETPTVELIFKNAIEPIYRITGYTTIGLRLWDEQQQMLILKAQKGLDEAMIKRLARIPRPVDEPYILPMLETKKAVIYDVPSSLRLGFDNVVFVPLLGNDKIVGSMDLGSKVPRVWTQDEIGWLELIGRYIGMMICQIQILKKIEILSALQERDFIARELHDDTLQSISSLIMWTQEANLSADEGNLPAVQSALEKIHQSADSAYKSLREDIFGLRRRSGTEEDFISAIENSLSIFQGYWNIKTSFRATKGQEPVTALKLSPRTEIQLLRIIQEALTNIRKHASATRVDVAVELSHEWINVAVEDNGKGFNPDVTSNEHLGLRIMRERAESLGGMIQIESRLGFGSIIRISAPRTNGAL